MFDISLFWVRFTTMPLNFARFGWSSLRYYWRGNAAIAMAVLIATAVLTGALLVGSSMRGSLRALTIERLGRIDEILVAEGFFSTDLADRLRQSPFFQEHYERVEPIIFFPNGSVESEQASGKIRLGQVSLLGIEPSFWNFDTLSLVTQQQAQSLQPGSLIINQTLADELGISAAQVATGEARLVVRIPKPSLLPGDSSLGRKRDLAESLARMKVVAIVKNQGLGRFSPHPSPEVPRLAFLALAELQQTLYDSNLRHRPNSQFANQLLVSGRDPQRPPSLEISKQLPATIEFPLLDLGLRLKRVTLNYSAEEHMNPVFDYHSLSTERLVFRRPLAEWIQQRWPVAEPVLTYLVNNIQRANLDGPNPVPAHPGIPYSMFSGLSTNSTIGLVSARTGQPIPVPQGNQVILNEWTAEDLQLEPGDEARLTYFQPESQHGQQVEGETVVKILDIAKLTEPDEPFQFRRRQSLQRPKFTILPTSANDPDLTPEVPGVTDADSMENWDLPFETSDRIRNEDDDYWANHRTTPKGFLSLALGQKLWSSRFGEVTSFRFPREFSEQEIVQALNELWRQNPSWFGVQWISIKRQGLLASSGSTPFDGLFLGLSLFVIVAALLLVVLLFRLSLEQRSTQLGLTRAVGFSTRRISRMLLPEQLLVAAGGAVLGIGFGFLFAQSIIAILTTWWVGAISQPFLRLHWQGWEPLAGMLGGVVMSIMTMYWSVRSTTHRSVRGLLSGTIEESTTHQRTQRPWTLYFIGLLAVIATGLAVLATTRGGEVQAGAFMGAGFLMLVAILMTVARWLGRNSSTHSLQQISLGQLALYSLRRNPRRSLLTIGLMAAATFLIVAISSFRLRPTDQSSGGIDWVGSSSQPVFADLNTREGQTDALGAEYSLPTNTRVYGWRLKPGEDASCNNPYQSTQPRILGVTPAWIARNDDAQYPSMRWSGSLARTSEQQRNPWHLLDAETTAGRAADAPVPVVIDKNTAMFSLKIYSVGQVFQLTYDSGETVSFQVVGFLENTFLQGSLLISESDFVRVFPAISGYRYFLVDTGPSSNGSSPSESNSLAAGQAISVLRDRLADQGFDARPADTILAELMAVQNTYLSAFQSLGGLGLLLGTLGLAAVQLRSMVERRQELGLLRAIGFSYQRLTRLLFWEQMSLLVVGLVSGCLAALFTTLPHYWWGGASIPWQSLALILAFVLALGLITAWWSARQVMRLPLLDSLKSS